MDTKMRMRIASKIEKTMQRNGIENVLQLHRQSNTALSAQTYYRVFDPDFRGNISLPVIIEVAYFAGCSKAEILGILKDTDDKIWHNLISTGQELSKKECLLLSVVRKITSANIDMWKSIAAQMEICCMAVGLKSCKNDLEEIARANGRPE